ncbi:fimbrial protein [Klebsiella aerogenes]|nr:fimbrial protein [Klebsiella aerogenes]
MNKKGLFAFILFAFLGSIPAAQADYFYNITVNTKSYDMSSSYIPQTVGATGPWMGTSVNSVDFQIGPDPLNSVGSEITLRVDSTLQSDGITWATSNPGVGIQFQLTTSPVISGLISSSTAAPTYPLTMTGYPTGGRSITISGKLNLAYRLVRLLETVPAGKITPPSVYVTFYNTYDHAMYSGTMYSGAAKQPLYYPCTIVAPTEIKLPTLYVDDLVNGAQGASSTYSIKLTNCPGAQNNITYMYAPLYGAYGDGTQGYMYTATGEGSAKYVYLQLQNPDGTGQAVNNNITLNNYTGSGDYTLPEFKVAYYIKDVNKATEGNVTSAIVIGITYN